tara:strand:- start:14 stop:1006 length:993 start_codon:yes stop_codon:yes gene_type:complete
MKKNKRIVIFGFGSIGRKYVRLIKKFFPNIEVFIISSRNINIYKESNLIDGNYIDHSNIKELNPDGVIIASPATNHLSDALNCLDLNIPILIEKPLSNSLKNVNNFKKKILEKKSKILIGYVLRYSSNANIFKENISNPNLGDLLFAKVICSSYLPNWRPGQDYRRTVSSSLKYGGGVLLELSHEIDYANWFFGPFLKVQAILKNSGTLDIDVEDTADLILTNNKGMNVVIHLDFCSRYPTRKCKLYGSKSTMNLDFLDKKLEIVNPKLETLLSNKEDDSDNMFVNQLRCFLKGVFHEDFMKNNLDDGIETLKIIESARLSNQLNKGVEL